MGLLGMMLEVLYFATQIVAVMAVFGSLFSITSASS